MAPVDERVALFRQYLEQMELTQQGAADWLQVSDRSVRRWVKPGAGYDVPHAVLLLFALMVHFDLTPADVDMIARDA